MIHRTILSCILTASLGAALACGPAFAADAPNASPNWAQPTVVFVCKYGSVKSLVAAERFNRLAEQRGLAVRAISRAANPENVHAKVPELVVRQMALEGFKVADVKPQVLTPEEASAALRVVHISLQGEDDPISAVAQATSHAPIEVWDDVPSMLRLIDASGAPKGPVDLTGRTYQMTRGLLIPHVDALVEELAKKQSSAAAK
jgi:protein-tyrosine-phosphatase